MEYKVLKAEKIIFLEQKVNEYLEKGWVLQGGISCDDDNYLQAMVLKVS